MHIKVRRLILLILLLTLAMSNIAYAEIRVKPEPYGPRVTELRNKEDILNNFQQIKTIRSNLTIIDIRSNSTLEQLKSTDASIQNYIQQIENIRGNLQKHISTYGDSFPDVFFSEQISFVADSYIISLRNQQVLVRAIENNIDEAKKLFYSSYMIPVYYYLTLGDQMTAYIDVYFVL